ncbi:MAG TPA: FG-GAP-like repeat-containing protein [Acidobacteriota bacterium]|nr:FG-GAP-like repeat-containing protein [Acidobacteriota bacterium]
MNRKVPSLTVFLFAFAGCIVLSINPHLSTFLRANPGIQAQSAAPRDVPNQVLRLNNRGAAELEKFDYRLAAEQFLKAVGLSPDFVPARINLGIAHYYESNYPKAIEALKAALKMQPAEPHAHFVLGLMYNKDNRREEALREFRAVLAVYPEDTATNYNLGLTTLRGRDYEEAIRYFQQVLDVEPRHLAALYNLGQAYMRAGRREDAQQMMARLKALRGEEQAGSPMGSMGSQYGDEGRFALAVTEYGFAGATAAVGKPGVRFVDVTAGAGIRFTHAGPGPEIAAGVLSRELKASEYSKEWAEKNLVPALGSGAAFLDYNLDGKMDLFLVNCGSRSALYRNNGDGTFTDVTEEAGLGAVGLGMGVAVGDYDNDGYPDLYITNYGRNVLYHNEKNGKFKNVTAEAGVGGSDTKWSLSAVFFDYDHDGDLDLLVTNFVDLNAPPHKDGFRFPDDFAGQGNTLFRNNGNGTFTDVTEQAKIANPGDKSTAAVFTDYNESRDIDFLVANYDASAKLYSNNRDGSFTDVSDRTKAAGPHSFFGIAAADLNGDGFTDFFFPIMESGGAGWLLENQSGRSFTAARIVPKGMSSTTDRVRRGWAASFMDYDNDGLLDIFEVADRCYLLRNLGRGQFEDASADAGLAALHIESPRSIAVGDYDGDGDLDVLVTNCGGRPYLLRNEGGNRNHYLKLSLAALNDNKAGIGSKVEIRAGAMRQKLEVNGYPGYLSQGNPELIFGLGKQVAVDSLKILWPTGVLQAEIDPKINNLLQIHQIDRKGTSCPILYAWDGSGYRFVTDFLGGSAFGSLEAPGHYNETDTDEYILVDSTQLKAKDGFYSLKMNDQLEEVMFIDQARLLAIDHPSDIRIFPNERLMPASPFPEFRIYQMKDSRTPIKATDDHGNDILPAISSIDRKYPSAFKLLPFKGYAEEHSITLDLGDLSSARKVLLLMNAWIDYADSTSNLAASQAGVHLIPPYLQVPDESGSWRTVIADMGFPAGLPKTMTVDLTGKFLSRRDFRIRIVTSMRIYWDQILVDTHDEKAPLRIVTLDAASATLGWGGYPQEYSPDGKKPMLYDYSRREQSSPWKSHVGNYTRYGDVTPLVRSKDDMYVVMHHGDEITLNFDGRDLPSPPEGWSRTFLVYADGFGKDMDLNSAYPDTVGPLPYHGMSGYPMAAPYPNDTAHRDYLREYNTRKILHVFWRLGFGSRNGD